MAIATITLNNGVTIPQLGLGTARTGNDESRRIVGTALGLGYRLIDTAAKYENEVGVGQGIADAGLPRDDLFITSKLRGRDHGFAATKVALAQTLDRLAAATSTVPAVNQIELHPQLPQRAQRADHARRGIVTESWPPLANAGALLKDPVLAEIGEQHGRSPAQVVLAWHLRQGLVVIPKAAHEDRLRANLDVFDLELTVDDLRRIDGLETGVRVGGQDPRTHEEF